MNSILRSISGLKGAPAAAAVPAAASADIAPAAKSSPVVKRVAPMTNFMDTLDPFLFCVYHNDNYPAGDEKMQAPRMGNGADFNPNQPYRMYHGERIPGFPAHPHRGFETITATMTGLIDHSDSLGCGGRYGEGDLQWMTAGKGVSHAEMFPLVNDQAPNPLRFFQIWINLPKKSKMVDPTYVMHWAEDIPRIKGPDGKSFITLWAGSLEGKKGLPPPPNSYASIPDSDVAVIHIELTPGGEYTLSAASGGSGTNRMAYFVDGKELVIGGKTLTKLSQVEVDASQNLTLKNTHATETTGVLILQGKPIAEPVAQRGPFVMNTQDELVQAYMDYQRTRFGGWPWGNDAPVFPRDAGRFSKVDGVEERPPSKA